MPPFSDREILGPFTRRNCLTVSVTRWWAGRGNAALTEPTSSHKNRLKTRRIPTSRVHAGLDAFVSPFKIINQRYDFPEGVTCFQ